MCCWCFRNTPIGAFSVPIDHVRAVIMVMTMSGCWWLTGWQWLWKTKIMEIFPMSVIRVLLSQWIICTKKHLQSNVHQHPRSIPLIDNWHSIYRYSIDTLADTPSSHDQHLGRKLTNVAGMAVSVDQYFWVGWHYSQLSVDWDVECQLSVGQVLIKTGSSDIKGVDPGYWMTLNHRFL